MGIGINSKLPYHSIFSEMCDLVSYEANIKKLVEMYNSRKEEDIPALELLMELTFGARRIDVKKSAMENGVIHFVQKRCPVLRQSSHVFYF